MKICKEGEYKEVRYTKSQWILLKKLRDEAKRMMLPFIKYGLNPLVYGSIARGDVKPRSDIDITFLTYIDYNIIETILMSEGINIGNRVIIMATPRYTPKGYIWLDSEGLRQISFFLSDPQPRSIEFYKFSGLLDYKSLMNNLRVSGVNKKLMLILPNRLGHVETCIIGREGETSKILGVSQDIIRERINILTRREAIGRTGVYLEYKLSVKETFGEAVFHLKNINRFFRRAIEGKTI